MKIKHFKHTGVSPSGKIASGGSVTVSGRVSKSAPDGGCGLDNCGCSPGHWISFCLPRTEEGVVEGVTIQFDNDDEEFDEREMELEEERKEEEHEG